MAYTIPTAADLKAYYPAFASADNSTVDLYIARVSGASGADVDQTWSEGDYAPGIMAAAAHRMARGGVLSSSSAAGGAAAGIDRFASGSVDIRFNQDAVKQAIGGGWRSTSYGLDYLELLSRNKAGPRVVAGGTVFGCNDGFNGYAGPVEPWQY
jgi:hypothetical protein